MFTDNSTWQDIYIEFEVHRIFHRLIGIQISLYISFVLVFVMLLLCI